MKVCKYKESFVYKIELQLYYDYLRQTLINSFKRNLILFNIAFLLKEEQEWFRFLQK